MPPFGPTGQWTPKLRIRLIVAGSGCLCLLSIFSVIMILSLKNAISSEILGNYKAGGGLAGVIFVICWLIQKTLGD